MRIFAISRAPRYSADAEERDARIFGLVVERLRALGHIVKVQDEDEFAATVPADHTVDRIVHMARSEAALRQLETYERLGIVVLNSPSSLLRYNTRAKRHDVLAKGKKINPEYTIYTAGQPYTGEFPVWAKALRNDAPAHCVELLPDFHALSDYLRRAVAIGVSEFSMERPIQGILVKFYGVEGSRFGKFLLPENLSDEQKKLFGDYFYEELHLSVAYVLRRKLAEDASSLGLTFFGGDIIIDDEGLNYYIDFNDFPSYGQFAEEAAVAIADRLLNGPVVDDFPPNEGEKPSEVKGNTWLTLNFR